MSISASGYIYRERVYEWIITLANIRHDDDDSLNRITLLFSVIFISIIYRIRSCSLCVSEPSFGLLISFQTSFFFFSTTPLFFLFTCIHMHFILFPIAIFTSIWEIKPSSNIGIKVTVTSWVNHNDFNYARSSKCERLANVLIFIFLINRKNKSSFVNDRTI